MIGRIRFYKLLNVGLVCCIILSGRGNKFGVRVRTRLREIAFLWVICPAYYKKRSLRCPDQLISEKFDIFQISQKTLASR